MTSRALTNRVRSIGLVACGLVCCGGTSFGDDVSPKVDERQLPFAMHSRMNELPTIRVGNRDADLIGADNRALQAAVDYIAGLGGGVVEIGEGEYHHGRLAAPSLQRNRPRTEGEDDPPESRRRDLSAGPRRRLRRAANHASETPRASRSAAGSRSGTTTVAVFTPPWHGSPDEMRTLSRSIPPDRRLHGRGPCQGGDRLPRCRRFRHPFRAGRGPCHRGEQRSQPSPQRLPRGGNLSLRRTSAQ